MCEPDALNIARHDPGMFCAQSRGICSRVAQSVPMVCEIVYRSSTRHLPRLPETSRRIEERLDVGCASQAYGSLVILAALVSQTISTSEALVRADAWTSTGSSLVLLAATGSHNIGTCGASVRQGASNSLRSSLCCLGHLFGTPSGPAGPRCAGLPRPASAHALCVWENLASTASAPLLP